MKRYFIIVFVIFIAIVASCTLIDSNNFDGSDSEGSDVVEETDLSISDKDELSQSDVNKLLGSINAKIHDVIIFDASDIVFICDFDDCSELDSNYSCVLDNEIHSCKYYFPIHLPLFVMEDYLNEDNKLKDNMILFEGNQEIIAISNDDITVYEDFVEIRVFGFGENTDIEQAHKAAYSNVNKLRKKIQKIVDSKLE